jgi:uncharacterized protein (TIGR00730 family)
MMTKNIKTVCVYCGASNNVDKGYFDLARGIGHALALANKEVVYGGGHVGLMGTVADSTLNAGGTVTGIIPHHLFVREKQHEGLSRLIVVDSMHDRKSKMVEQSDAFVILPGGFGTMDETFEIITWKQLGLHDKPIILMNHDGYWDAFVELTKSIVDHGFAKKSDLSLFEVVNSAQDLVPALDNASPQDFKADTSSI